MNKPDATKTAMNTGRIAGLIDKLRGDKEFFGLVATIVFATISVLAWANANFVTAAKAEQMIQ